jgi:K+-transporting ATPase KdpF subunit
MARRFAGGSIFMNPVYVVAGLIAVALLIYLFLALLKPEKFG